MEPTPHRGVVESVSNRGERTRQSKSHARRPGFNTFPIIRNESAKRSLHNNESTPVHTLERQLAAVDQHRAADDCSAAFRDSCRAARWAVRHSAGCSARNARQARTAAGCSAEAQAAGAAPSKATASGRAATRANTTDTAPGSDAATRCSGETAGSKCAAATRPSRATGAGGAGAPRGAPGRTPPRPATAGAGRAAATAAGTGSPAATAATRTFDRAATDPAAAARGRARTA